jgi:hypothetical protein
MQKVGRPIPANSATIWRVIEKPKDTKVTGKKKSN